MRVRDIFLLNKILWRNSIDIKSLKPWLANRSLKSKILPSQEAKYYDCPLSVVKVILLVSGFFWRLKLIEITRDNYRGVTKDARSTKYLLNRRILSRRRLLLLFIVVDAKI